MNQKHQKIIQSIFAKPTPATIKFAEIEKLLMAIGAERYEGRGSRVAFIMPDGLKWEAHRPHPQKEAKKYQVESVRTFLEKIGVSKDE
jgi:hypothetical protein